MLYWEAGTGVCGQLNTTDPHISRDAGKRALGRERAF